VSSAPLLLPRVPLQQANGSQKSEEKEGCYCIVTSALRYSVKRLTHVCPFQRPRFDIIDLVKGLIFGLDRRIAPLPIPVLGGHRPRNADIRIQFLYSLHGVCYCPQPQCLCADWRLLGDSLECFHGGRAETASLYSARDVECGDGTQWSTGSGVVTAIVQRNVSDRKKLSQSCRMQILRVVLVGKQLCSRAALSLTDCVWYASTAGLRNRGTQG
jgi:hypothetical protein